MKRGHSNVYTKEITRQPNGKARIPISGGASVHGVKELPPLALDQEEWQEIGEAMGWIQSDRSRNIAAFRQSCRETA